MRNNIYTYIKEKLSWKSNQSQNSILIGLVSLFQNVFKFDFFPLFVNIFLWYEIKIYKNNIVIQKTAQVFSLKNYSNIGFYNFINVTICEPSSECNVGYGFVFKLHLFKCNIFKKEFKYVMLCFYITKYPTYYCTMFLHVKAFFESESLQNIVQCLNS